MVKLNQAQPIEGETKAVIGPGTGLGHCFMTKAPGSKNYEVFKSEVRIKT